MGRLVQPTAAQDLLVIRSPGRWSVAPAARREDIEISSTALRVLLGSTNPVGSLDPTLLAQLEDAGALVEQDRQDPEPRSQPSTIAGTELPPPLDDEAVVAPVAAFVARVAPGSLHVETTGGHMVALDLDDLALIEVVGSPTTVLEVADRFGAAPVGPTADILARRLRRLVDAGQLEARHEPHPEAEAPGLEDPAASSPPPMRVASGPSELPSVRRYVGARLRQAPIPGRRHLVRAYRMIRRHPGGSDVGPSAEELVGKAVAPEGPPPHAEVLVQDPVEQDPDEHPGQGGSHSSVVVEPQPGRLAVRYHADPLPGPRRPEATTVYAVWQAETGPALSLGMVTAAARQHEKGALNERFDIRRPEDPSTFVPALDADEGPALLLLSNYVWSVEDNLDVARRAVARNPELLVVHGGPSTPKYEGDCERFFEQHADVVHVAIRGEGEATLVAALAALADGPGIDVRRLAGVEGLTYRDPESGRVVRTPDRDRLVELDVLPSPYLTGEFDHIDRSAWEVPSGLLALTFESNRGCPYGCTFCDWGSSTLSRIRKFDLDRLTEEMRWAAERGFGAWMLADANFGIISRDVELAERLAAIKAEHGAPADFGFNVAKNTTKHLTAILDRLVRAGVVPHFSLALQTTDEATLEAVRRTNISTDHYVALAASFRRLGLPLNADIMVGLPGQTVDSLAGDLQFLIDHGINGRMWITELLPNSPMNDPEYKAEFEIDADEHNLVRATSTFTRADREAMLRLRHAYTAFERFGVLRHVSRFLQWDHQIESIELQRRIISIADEHPERYPLLGWVMRYFDYFNVPPLGWRSFAAEVRRFVGAELGVQPNAALDTVLDLQAFLMPAPGRRFPDTIALAHDVVQYERDKTDELWRSGHARSDDRRLEDYGPSSFTVYADPLDRCTEGLQRFSDPRNEVMTERFWLSSHWELDSPLVQNFPEVAAAGSFVGPHEQAPADLPDDSKDVGTSERIPEAIRVQIGDS
jgi:radical SAM superfamily enzyme YgiQ (UPF0313 family)